MTSPDPRVLDVRPLLRRGEEPLGAILAAVDALHPRQALRLLTPFKPLPLVELMRVRGYGATLCPLGDGGWQVTFRPTDCEPTTSPDHPLA